MKKIIVTITNTTKTFFYDIEVPTDVPVQLLKKDILDTLEGYDSKLFFSDIFVGLFLNRLNKQLYPNETLADAGVWTGDYITLLGV